MSDLIRQNSTELQAVLRAIEYLPNAGAGGGSDTDTGIIERTISGAYVNNNVRYVSEYAFYKCSELTRIDMANCSYIGTSAFMSCCKLTMANFPACSEIASSAFYSCDALMTISFPECQKIGPYAFARCYSMTAAIFPQCSTVSSYAFRMCWNVNCIDFPKCVSVSDYAFDDCRRLTSVNLRSCATIGNGTFNSCSSLQVIDLPVCVSLPQGAFQLCHALASINIPACSSIGSYAFSQCYNLSSLTLGGTSICTLADSNIFTFTPYDGCTRSFFGKPSIYVPKSLVSAYKSANNWSYFASMIASNGFEIDSMDNYTIPFTQSKQVELLVHRLNGPVVCNVVSSDNNIATISDIIATDEKLTFNINAGQVSGNTNITVTATSGDESVTKETTIRVYDADTEPIYEVQAIYGAANGFKINSNGYYESKNKGVNSSYAVCKLVFNATNFYRVYLDCINYAQSAVDYGLISKLDTELALNRNEDASSNLLASFKGKSSSNVQTIEIPVNDSNEHFVYIKFIKDGSYHYYNDSLQFKVRFEPK